MRSTYSPARSRFALLTAGATALLLAAGASVTSTGSGLAVPDWPLSFGSVFPRMTGGVVFEHGHRVIAGVVALLIVTLAVLVVRGEARAWVRWASVAAVGMVILQAVLGGLTVLLKLPASVSVAHAALAQAVFTVVTVIAIVSSARWSTHTTPAVSVAADARIARAALGVAVLVYAQVILGAVVRHTGSGLIFADFPLSGGRVIPAFTHPSMALQFAHRAGAALVTAIIVVLVVQVRRTPNVSRRTRGLSMHVMGMVFVQFLLGATAIWTRLAPLVTVLHVVCGALVLASAASLALWGRHNSLARTGVSRGWIADTSMPRVRAAASTGSLSS